MKNIIFGLLIIPMMLIASVLLVPFILWSSLISIYSAILYPFNKRAKKVWDDNYIGHAGPITEGIITYLDKKLK